MAVALLLLPCGASARARATLQGADWASFTRLVQDYQGYVVPVCRREAAGGYAAFNMKRDVAFVRSLEGTPLREVRRDAMRAKAARDAGMVFHCFGPPSPGVIAAQMDPRQRAIAIAQDQLRQSAAAIPGYFDAGDSAFARLIALRDRILSGQASQMGALAIPATFRDTEEGLAVRDAKSGGAVRLTRGGRW